MGINIIENNETKIIIIAIISASLFYSDVLYRKRPVPLASKLIGLSKNRRFSNKNIWSIFRQFCISITSYHDLTDWLQYQINLDTWVQIKFGQKTNIALNSQIEPQIIPELSACTRYAKWWLWGVVSYYFWWDLLKEVKN